MNILKVLPVALRATDRNSRTNSAIFCSFNARFSDDASKLAGKHLSRELRSRRSTNNNKLRCCWPVLRIPTSNLKASLVALWSVNKTKLTSALFSANFSFIVIILLLLNSDYPTNKQTNQRGNKFTITYTISTKLLLIFLRGLPHLTEGANCSPEVCKQKPRLPNLVSSSSSVQGPVVLQPPTVYLSLCSNVDGHYSEFVLLVL